MWDVFDVFHPQKPQSMIIESSLSHEPELIPHLKMKQVVASAI